MKLIQLTQGKRAKIDDRDLERVALFRWHATYADGRWYACSRRRGKKLYMHRLILGLLVTEDIDHRDGDGLNNQRRNLRKATTQQNQANRGPTAHSSVYKGVFRSHTGKWRAQIYFNYRSTHIGYFKTEMAAARAYDKKAVELFGKFARTNFRRRVAAPS